MKKLLLAGVLAALLAAVPARAQSDFDGTWRIDLTKSVMPTKAEAFLLQNGIYQCKSCVPIINILLILAIKVIGCVFFAKLQQAVNELVITTRMRGFSVT